MTEEELAKHIQNLQELKKQDANIDIATLALSALASQQENLLSPKEKNRAYLLSMLIPPFAGMFFAAKFYTSGKSDGKSAAYMCLAITVISIILAVAFGAAIFKGSGLNTQQIQQAPQQYQDLLRP